MAKNQKAAHRSSAPQNTSTGSGSRPGAKSRYPIGDSAPKDPKTLGRSTPGALK